MKLIDLDRLTKDMKLECNFECINCQHFNESDGICGILLEQSEIDPKTYGLYSREMVKHDLLLNPTDLPKVENDVLIQYNSNINGQKYFTIGFYEDGNVSYNDSCQCFDWDLLGICFDDENRFDLIPEGWYEVANSSMKVYKCYDKVVAWWELRLVDK